jgi:hypothetical protein
VDLLLAPIVLVWMALPVAVVLVPPITAAACRRVTAPAALLYAAALGLTVAYIAASLADMERADLTGGSGSAFAGGLWLVAAVAAATTATCLSVRREVVAG